MENKWLFLLVLLVPLANLQVFGANGAPNETYQVAQAGQENQEASSGETRLSVEQKTSAERSGYNTGQLVGQLLGPIVALIAAIVAFLSFRWGVKNWRWTYFTKEWSKLMQLLKNDPQFMDCSKTREYRTHFTRDDSIKYDLVARLCIGYLDDLYFLRSEKEMLTYFKGSIKLLGGTHRTWLEDNADSYHKPFYDFIIKELNR